MCKPNPQVTRAHNLKCFGLGDAQLKPASSNSKRSSIFQTERCPTQTHKYQEQQTEKKTNCSDVEIPNSNPQISMAENLADTQLKPRV